MMDAGFWLGVATPFAVLILFGVTRLLLRAMAALMRLLNRKVHDRFMHRYVFYDEIGANRQREPRAERPRAGGGVRRRSGFPQVRDRPMADRRLPRLPERQEKENAMSVNAYQPVLDPASSGRMFWFDKHDTRVLFGDIRDESWELCDGRRFDVKPDMEMDYRDLPFPDGTFRMVVLDPPHLRHVGENAYMAKKYGALDPETWQEDLRLMFRECFRVLKPYGVLIFKWNEVQIPLSKILKLCDEKPLFGNKQPKQTGTHWIVFMKAGTEEQ